MKWNHRIVHMNEGRDEEPWFQIQEVYYNDDGSIAGYANPCIGDEYPSRMVEVLQCMLDDIKTNPDVVLPSKVVGSKTEEAAF